MPLHSDIFDKVLFIGPDYNAKGGIASVLAAYRRNFTPFHFCATNSDHGKAAGYLNALRCLAMLPVHRLRGRKIAHIHYAAGRSWTRKQIIAYWARMLGYKIVFHCHSAEFKDFTAKKTPEYIASHLNRSSCNIVLSESWREFFDTVIHARNIEVLNNIVDNPRPFRTVIPAMKRPVTFLFLGYIGDRKGIFDIIDALSMLPEDASYRLIVGGNGETEKLKNLISTRHLEDKVKFVGWATGDKKHQLLSEADVLMLPSYAEGLPIAILEAMAYSKAIITSPVGGIAEIVTDGENGFMVTPGDTAAIAAAMERYLADGDLAIRHGCASHSRIAPFLPDAVGARLEEIYIRILDDRSL